jgi:UDP-N-acetylglucosamine 2-epimerase (hydrolysing)
MKKVAFLTGTRADFGKIKPLLASIDKLPEFELHLFVTGMHLLEQYGYTILEVERTGFGQLHTFENFTSESSMELTLAKTIEGFSNFVRSESPDLIFVHGDRVEALAGAIVGSLNNVLVGHIEGGELSGTIDDLLRHSISKLSHMHFVANDDARKRLLQMGESEMNVHVIGSPDIDVMLSDSLPSKDEVLAYYEIPFTTYGIGLFHPVTTEHINTKEHVRAYVNALKRSDQNWLLVYPNNDLGSKEIISALQSVQSETRFKVLPSLRFEYFLTLLKNAQLVIGNSSAGIREAPFYGIPSVNIGSRQKNRSNADHIINVDNNEESIVQAILLASESAHGMPVKEFGDGRSAERFIRLLLDERIWDVDIQKPFVDLF